MHMELGAPVSSSFSAGITSEGRVLPGIPQRVSVMHMVGPELGGPELPLRTEHVSITMNLRIGEGKEPVVD